VDAHLSRCAECRAELEALGQALRLADSALRGWMADEASPSLRHRIRRAAAEPGGARRHPLGARQLAWNAAAGGLAVAAAALVGVWRSAMPSAVPAAPPPRATAEERALPPVAEGRAAAVGSEDRARIPARRPVEPQEVRRRREPEVLVPPGQAEDLLRFAAALQERQVEPGSLLASAPTDPLVEPPAIDIVALEIASLDSSPEPSLEEGDRP
jgi:hypothetical protein